MTMHEHIRRILAIEQEETLLWTEIAAMVPSASLRDVIMRMIQMETRGIEFWRRLLPGGEFLGGMMPGGGMPGMMPGSEIPGSMMPGGGMMPGDEMPGGSHPLVHKIKRAIRLDTEELRILAEMLPGITSPVMRAEVIRKAREEVNELTFWNTLLLAFETGVMSFEVKSTEEGSQ